MKSEPDHSWRFFSAGGFDQVKLESAADLRRLAALDQKLWVALACPTSGLEIDPRTLALIDTDKDGRVRAAELIAAVSFACANLKDPDGLLEAEAELPLTAINDATPEGKTLLSAAKQILANIGKPEARTLAVEDLADPVKIFAGSAFNGDGVITELSADDDKTRADIQAVVTCVGGVPDRSGALGVDQEKLDAFFAEAQAFADWHAKAAGNAAVVLPLGLEGTLAAFAAVSAVRHKVDDYFTRCRLAAFDPRAGEVLNRREEVYLDLAARDLSETSEEVARFPLALVAAERPLPLAGPVNPAHATALAALRDAAVSPILGARAQLTEVDWKAVLAKLGPHADWMTSKVGALVEPLGEARVRDLLASGTRDRLHLLIEKDRALEAEAASLENIERLVRYNRDLALLCTNFVNFKDFYDGGEPSVFQNGTLYLDQRACRLCLRVEDAGKHAAMAGLAGVYLAYLDCVRKGSNEKMIIVAAFTAGDSDNLMVGRNGVFYDRKGQDWDATITKIVDNPISIRQAFWSPYKKLARMLEEQVAKRAATEDKQSDALLLGAATTAAHADKTKPPEPKKIDVGTVAALGVAVGAIGTFFTALVGYATGIFQLGPLAVLGAIVGVMALISLPSVILAFLKLRKRNLGPILDANGWAVNAKAKVNIPFGATLTSVAKLPPGSKRDRHDPYAERGLPWKRVLLALVILYAGYTWYRGTLDRFLPARARAGAVLGRATPVPAPQ
ncbi:MAG TPA: hypothetical protein VMT47_01205 [Polyangia bacterium]|nr:hypothetical protein [Polyangia bacterium]